MQRDLSTTTLLSPTVSEPTVTTPMLRVTTPGHKQQNRIWVSVPDPVVNSKHSDPLKDAIGYKLCSTHTLSKGRASPLQNNVVTVVQPLIAMRTSKACIHATGAGSLYTSQVISSVL